MATVKNNRAIAAKTSQAVTFKANGKDVTLTPDIVKSYLVSGNETNITMQELVMFINLCKFNGLNPWLKEAYLIKYGSSPATLVTSKEAYLKRAEANPAYDGKAEGLIVLNTDGEVEHRDGAFYMEGEEILGAWCEVYRKDRSHPTREEVSFKEYAGRTKDGSLNSQWATKPATMIRKVAIVHALREAFPGVIGGGIIPEEKGLTEEEAAPDFIDITGEGEQPQRAAAQTMPEESESDSLL